MASIHRIGSHSKGIKALIAIAYHGKDRRCRSVLDATPHVLSGQFQGSRKRRCHLGAVISKQAVGQSQKDSQ